VRQLFAAVFFLVGLGMSAGYLFYASNAPSAPLGSWPVFTRDGGFIPVEARLKPEDAPVEVFVDLATAVSPDFGKDQAVLTLTAAAGGRTALAVPLSFAGAVSRDDAPQTPELIYRARAGEIATIDAETPLVFTVDRGDVDEIEISGVDLVLEHARPGPDNRVAPIGYAVMAVGAVAFLLSLRKRPEGPPPNPNSQPPPPRWGRAGSGRQ
jgi:hypothetical protein